MIAVVAQTLAVAYSWVFAPVADNKAVRSRFVAAYHMPAVHTHMPAAGWWHIAADRVVAVARMVAADKADNRDIAVVYMQNVRMADTVADK